MDRREMLKGTVLIAVASIPPFGWSICDGVSNEIHGPRKPYDPVAVLEAMRERFEFKLEFGGGLVFPFWHVNDEVGFLGPLLKGNECSFDFPSAVRWLHAQAAAADPDFAKAWPVPE